MKHLHILILAVLTALPAAAQQWLSPMPDYPMILSANFAEARPSHLHSGIDIKTGGVEGHRIVAVRDGYVSRIGVKPYGYGRVLYITHDDGSVSVYGHISRFIPSLEQYVKKMRYATKTNNVDLFPEKDLFRFKAGELVTYSGNSGSSGGPHLHFEIRRGADQRPINVIHEGLYKVKDGIPPIVAALHFFACDTVEGVPMDRKIKTYTPVAAGGGRYVLAEPVKIPCKGYFAVEVTDRKDGTQNTMGIYDIVMKADGDPRFRLTLDSFSFAETRYVNSLMVYDMQKRSRNEVVRLARCSNNLFSGLSYRDRSGVIDPRETDSITVEILDDTENAAELSFAVELDTDAQIPTFSRPDNTIKVSYDRAGTLSSGDFSVDFPAGSLFQSSFMGVTVADRSLVKSAVPVLSDIYCFSDEYTPFFTNATVTIRMDEVPAGAVIARFNPKTGTLASAGAKVSGKAVSAATSTGGSFCVAMDTVPPKITPVFPQGFAWATSKSVSFKMSDNFSGVASYSLKVDGEFAILEHVMKKATLVHVFDDEKFGKGKEHRLVLSIRDGAGNLAVYTKTYKR